MIASTLAYRRALNNAIYFCAQLSLSSELPPHIKRHMQLLLIMLEEHSDTLYPDETETLQ